MYTFFISDLHLVETKSKRAKLFLRFLKEQANRSDALYILGDFFDVWVGDDGALPFHREIISALKRLTNSGVAVFFMPGNRDFLVGKRFLKDTGCKLLTDPAVINVYGVPVLVMHGDLLCANDRSYRLFRRIIRNGFIRWLALLLPLKLRWALAGKMRKISIKKNENEVKERHIPDERIARILSDYHVNYLIHGHTHKPNIYCFNLNGHKAVRAVLGEWENTGSVLVCQSIKQQGVFDLDLKLKSIV